MPNNCNVQLQTFWTFSLQTSFQIQCQTEQLVKGVDDLLVAMKVNGFKYSWKNINLIFLQNYKSINSNTFRSVLQVRKSVQRSIRLSLNACKSLDLL